MSNHDSSSDQLNELATALAKAQGEILAAPKDANNPFFHSKYASLPAVREAMREAFAKNGLSVVQIPEVAEGQLRLKTLLLHSSGQSLDCGVLIADVDLANPQKIGSAITYFRRYALAAVSQTVADEDDDANAASQPSEKPAKGAKLTGHDVVRLQQRINAAKTVPELADILKTDEYLRLKTRGPKDVYEQTSSLAKAKHVVLVGEEQAEIATMEEEEPKPF